MSIRGHRQPGGGGGRGRMARVGVCAVLLAAAGPAPAFAHKPSDSTLGLRLGAHGEGRGRWDIAIRDLDDVLALDADGDGNVTWGELRRRTGDVAGYALDRLSLRSAAGPCRVESAPLALALAHHSDGAYVSLPLTVACPVAAGRDVKRDLTLDYRLLFEVDAQHRGLVDVAPEGGGAAEGATFVLTADDHVRRIDGGGSDSDSDSDSDSVGEASGGRGRGAVAFVADGARHIWGGLDHVLFLVALLLPAVMRRRDGAWVAVASLGAALADVGKIVTAFTVAHSLTLSLAALGIVRVPAGLTEPAIAASVIVAAVNNLHPVFGRDRWVVAFALGLLHGFGFSSVLADLALPRGRLLGALFGFNIGVELGQLAIVAALVPLAFLLRRTAAYRRVALLGGSAAVALVATVWFVARLLDISQWS